VIAFRVAGIPCLIRVDYVHITSGTYSRQAETPDEYYGDRTIEFTVCDRRGRPAPWLERKMNDQDTLDIEELILNQESNDD
jgi:hypothetical protein